MKFLTTIFLFMSIVLNVNAQEVQLVTDKDLNNHYITIPDKSYKVLEFKKRIKNIKVSDSEKISLEFVDVGGKPLQTVKIFAIGIGYANALLTFSDDTTAQVNFNIVNDLKSIVNLIEVAYPGVKIAQVGDNIVLKGSVESTKEKKKIYEILTKANIDTAKKVIDTMGVDRPENMIRIKLYAVEINNNKGLTLQNNWVASSKNYKRLENLTYKKGNGDTVSFDDTNFPLTTFADVGFSSELDSVNNQRNTALENALLSKIAQDSVTLTGGLTGVANYLGKYFNLGLTLNYLSEKGVARVLDETTLITTEGNDADFHAGGYITVKTATTSQDGVPVTELKEINYGLKLNFKVSEVINGSYVSMNINTEQSDADWSNTVDNIPSITTKSVKTNVIAQNNATIVLGGLVQKDQSQSINKIPWLGDIPVLGFLFRSEAFQSGASELVFFIKPEIVNTITNNQKPLLDEVQKDIENLDTKYNVGKKEEEYINESQEPKTTEVYQTETSNTSKSTDKNEPILTKNNPTALLQNLLNYN